LPPCGIAHHPKEVFFAQYDPSTIRKGVITVYGFSAALLAILIALAIYISWPIFGGIAALGLAYLVSDQIGMWRTRKISGLYADDLHVALITNTSFWTDRKVFDRTAVLESVISTRFSVVGTDGSTLFATSLISNADIDRFVAFLGCRVVRDTPVTSGDPIAVPPAPTPIGVLPLRIRRAAGLMQSVAGLLVGLSIINIPLLLRRVPEERRLFAIELLAALGIYGAALFWLGFRLAKGRPRSRETALIGGAGLTGFFVVAMAVINDQWQVAAIFCAVAIGLYALIYYWLREPVVTPTSAPPPPVR
ncbi:MAG TPA: hypothetical protein VNA65_11830, partial [Candidatus Dormibacteraeota bacterium]|nr:hypothetical protein [Candidatus Dormibacteraeota bacterium]